MSDIRTFIGISIPPDVSAVLMAGRALINSNQDLNWVPDSDYHITVKFLGHLPVSTIDEISAMVKGITRATHPFSIKVDRLELAPPQGAPHMIWAHCAAEEGFFKLGHDLEDMLEPFNIPKERHLQIPHIRLVRFNKSNPAKLSSDLNGLPLSFSVNQINLFESVRDDAGKHYIIRQSFNLGGTVSDLKFV